MDATLQPDGTLAITGTPYRLCPYPPLRNIRRAWLVSNLVTAAVYLVEQLHSGRWRCGCPASRFNPSRTCKHAAAARALVAAAEAAGLARRPPEGRCRSGHHSSATGFRESNPQSSSFAAE